MVRRGATTVVLASAVVAAATLVLAGSASAAPRRAHADATLAFTSPATLATVHGVLDLTGTAEAATGVARVDVRVDEHPYRRATGTTDWSLAIDTSAYSEGRHNLKARVTDASGNRAWTDLPIVIRNMPRRHRGPAKITFTAPAARATVRKTTDITGKAAARRGVARVEVQVDEGVYRRASGLGDWSIALDTSLYADGRHVVTVRVTDAAGKRVSSRRAFVVDNHPKQIYWGALVSGGLYGYGDPPWDMRGLRTFERHAGKKVSILALGANWGDRHRAFPTAQMEKIRKHGSIPLYSWASMAAGGAEQPKYRMSRIIDGTFDGYIRRFARAAKAWGHPFFLRFDWEMNLQNWYPWIETVNGNKRGDYVKMWRHVHRIFTSVGAKNVTWVWCPNAEYSRSIKPLSSLYPGNAYVDWTCIDGYNWGENPWRRNIWQTFTEVIGPTYRNIVANVAPSKPVMIGETASSEYGGSKAGWITDTLSVQLPHKFRHVQAFIWFNVKDKADWQIETSPKARRAFRAAIRSDYYAGADFALLDAKKVRPLPP